MKLTHKFAILSLFGGLSLSSCDKGFEEMNKNPNAFQEPTLNSLFSYNVITTAGTSDDNTLYPNDKITGCYMQYFASLNTFQWTGDKYVRKNSYDGGLFIAVTNAEVKENTQLITLTKTKPELSNLYNINRIWRVYIFHRGTDLYGDMPYTEAGKGLEGILKPKYDKQSFIYPHMLKELEEAAAALVVDPAKTSYGAADYLYAGNIPKWKTFAYSLMLRLGLRLSKVDPVMSKSYVQKAIAGGVMKSNADIAKLNHVDGTDKQFYWDGRELRGAEGVPPAAQGKGYGKMNKTFVDYLKNENDPRLPFYITLWQGNADPSKQSTSTLPASQRGLPGGYDNASIKTAIPSWNDAVDLPTISEINLNTVSSNSTPTIFQEYAEVEFYLAEAALRGWGPGTPQEHYEKAIRANMAKSVDVPYPGGFSISTTAVNAYIAAHAYNNAGTFEQQMRQIHTELWASLFMNNMEVYANWRRTGYPLLTPTNYVGNETGGTIPRRVVYPQAESTLNSENYAAAVAIQGPDAFTTRIWWDK